MNCKSIFYHLLRKFEAGLSYFQFFWTFYQFALTMAPRTNLSLVCCRKHVQWLVTACCFFFSVKSAGCCHGTCPGAGIIEQSLCRIKTRQNTALSFNRLNNASKLSGIYNLLLLSALYLA